MKIISWNINGLRSAINTGFINKVNQFDADFFCLQETKINKNLEELQIDNYYQYYNYCMKNGYAGVGILAKKEPINILRGMEIEDEYGEIYQADNESRVITLEYNNFYIMSVYIPHAQNKERLNYRQNFDEKFIEYARKLNNQKDVIICGDFNICHKNIDVCNFKKHSFLDNFSDETRASFAELLEKGFVDTYRYMHPQMREYTFWKSNDVRSEKQTGWRLDYILVSEYLKKDIREANILKDIGGSDHCPIELILKV